MDRKNARFNILEYDVFDISTNAFRQTISATFFIVRSTLLNAMKAIFCKETKNKARPMCRAIATPDYGLVFCNIDSFHLLCYFLKTCQCSYSIVLFAFTNNNNGIFLQAINIIYRLTACCENT